MMHRSETRPLRLLDETQAPANGSVCSQMWNVQRTKTARLANIVPIHNVSNKNCNPKNYRIQGNDFLGAGMACSGSYQCRSPLTCLQGQCGRPQAPAQQQSTCRSDNDCPINQFCHQNGPASSCQALRTEGLGCGEVNSPIARSSTCSRLGSACSLFCVWPRESADLPITADLMASVLLVLGALPTSAVPVNWDAVTKILVVLGVPILQCKHAYAQLIAVAAVRPGYSLHEPIGSTGFLRDKSCVTTAQQKCGASCKSGAIWVAPGPFL